MLVLCLGLRQGEVLGLTWESIDFETGELYVDHQIQRAERQLLHRETKTEESDDFLPLPAVCLKALRLRHGQQTGNRNAVDELADRHDDGGLSGSQRGERAGRDRQAVRRDGRNWLNRPKAR
ncbi:hypothetical protein [Streptomyces sp. cmx-4-7]|uniref:hypothetical protein n=1 Tax=Streptomyces sp. cmx-4-7 TaxID=2790939 RepID=UPI00398155C7